jgi:hypothetical protein
VLDDGYMSRASAVAGQQLARAGFRLASLLNGIWTQPSDLNDTGRTAPVPTTAVDSSANLAKSQTGPVIGNQRSRIYAWPGAEAMIRCRRRIASSFLPVRQRKPKATERRATVRERTSPSDRDQPSSTTSSLRVLC